MRKAKRRKNKHLAFMTNPQLDLDGASRDRKGAVYLFERQPDGSARLSASDGEKGDSFGSAIALNGDWLLIGAFGMDKTKEAAYIFEREDDGS